MKNELLLIIGPSKSGKTWLAAALSEVYYYQRKSVQIFEEPNLNSEQIVAELKDYTKEVGHVIVICSLVTSAQLKALAPDRVYSIGIRMER